MKNDQENAAPDNYDEEVFSGLGIAKTIIMDTPDAAATLRKIKAEPLLMRNIEIGFLWLIQFLNENLEKNPVYFITLDGECYGINLQICLDGVKQALEMILALKRGDLRV